MMNHTQAIQCFKLAYFILKKKDTCQKSKLIGILNNLGLTYLNLQDFEKSYKYFKQCINNECLQQDISLCRSQFDLEETDISKSDVLNNLGIVCEHLQKFDEAITYYENAIIIYKQQENFALNAKVLNNMVSVYQQKQDIQKAFLCCQESLDIRLEFFGENSHDTIESYQNLATLYEHNLQYDEAIKTYKMIKSIKQRYFPKENLSLAKTLSSIAIIFLQLKKYDQALQIQLQALDLRQQKISLDQNQQFDLAENLFNIGFIYKNLKDYQTSSDFFQQAISLLKQNEKKNSEHIIIILQNESQNHLCEGNKDESVLCLKMCLNYLEKSNKDTTELYKEIVDNISFVKRQSTHVFDFDNSTPEKR